MYRIPSAGDIFSKCRTPIARLKSDKPCRAQISNVLLHFKTRNPSKQRRHSQSVDGFVYLAAQIQPLLGTQQLLLLSLIVLFSLFLPIASQATESQSPLPVKQLTQSSQLPVTKADSQKNSLNPRSNIWRKVREGTTGYSAVSGPEAGQLIEANGEVWRRIRNGPLSVYGAWVMVCTLLALALFYTIRGKVMLTIKRTGKKLLRWSVFERFIHWYTALLFILLSISGLSILYGRSTLIQLIGHQSFAVWAYWAKLIHNYTGPLFMAGLFTMIIIWFKDNIPDKYDINWFKAFGGLIGKQHPSAARMNAGEKVWFWMLFWCGMFISLTGLVLDFPVLEQERFILQITHIIHLSCAILLITGALGHIYIGTVGTEGALEGMVSGEVDEAWAKQHHDIWLAQEQEKKQQQQESGSAHTAINRLRNISEQLPE